MELLDLFPEIQESRRTDRTYTHFLTTKEWSPNNKLRAALKTLKRRYPNNTELKRGDLVYLETELQRPNYGKYIFDGEEIQKLNYKIHPSGTVPESFEVIMEFPLHYWKDRILGHSLVPFSYLSDVSPDEIQFEGNVAYLPFQNDGQIYYLVAPKMKRSDLVKKIEKTLYFLTTNMGNLKFKLATEDNTIYLA